MSPSGQGSGSTSKRQKNSEGSGQQANGNFQQNQPFSQQPFQQPPYGGPQQAPGGLPSGYMWQPGQQQQPPPYGNQMAPVQHWQNAQQGPNGMYRASPPPGGGPPMSGNYGGYRGSPPPQGGGSSQGRRSNKSSQRSGHKSSGSGGGTPSNLPPGASYQSWGQPQQWAQNQWGGGPPPQMWQGGPTMHPPGPSPPPGQSMPQHMQGQPMGAMAQPWQGGSKGSPKRQTKGRPRASPDPLMAPGIYAPQPGMLNGLPDNLCKPIGLDGGPDQDMYLNVSQGDDESRTKPSGGSSVTSRDKGRGSYRCGRCGVPKKGHVCPYQPKLKRRPDEPPPETRNAAIQVEMDEFMTLRRLNIEIQGFPESYATGSVMMESAVIGEPHPLALGDAGVISQRGFIGNEAEVAQLSSIPPHIASQSTATPAESDGVKTSSPTTVENAAAIDVPQAEQEKGVA